MKIETLLLAGAVAVGVYLFTKGNSTSGNSGTTPPNETNTTVNDILTPGGAAVAASLGSGTAAPGLVALYDAVAPLEAAGYSYPVAHDIVMGNDSGMIDGISISDLLNATSAQVAEYNAEILG